MSKHADPRRIHELEYELGFRDDPPPFTDAPGQIITMANCSSVLKECWAADAQARRREKQEHTTYLASNGLTSHSYSVGPPPKGYEP